jgi:hypothetical protein
MTDTPKPEEIIDITGPKNETVFYHAKSWLLTGKEHQIQAHLDDRWQHYGKATDDRLVAIVAALCIETSIDALLTSVAPGFRHYIEDTDFTLSIKIKVAKSLRLVPTRILSVCDLIRQIRNQFAHNVDKKRFEDLEEKYLKKLEPYVKSFNTAERNPSEVQRLFKDLVNYTLIALIVYTEQVSHLRSFIEDDHGKKSFGEWCQQSGMNAVSPSSANE